MGARDTTMRTLLLAGILALLVASPAALAQQSGSVTVKLEPLSQPLTPENSSVTQGVVTLTVDFTAYTGIAGIPVTYTVTNQPAWATVVLSPASDVFPVPATPSFGAAYTVSRAVTITIDAAPNASASEVSLLEITATTQPGAFAGKSFSGKGSIPLRAASGDCDHAADSTAATPPSAEGPTSSTNAPLAAPATAQPDAAPVKVQSASPATPLAMGWLATGAIVGFGAVGAGVGLFLRRR